MRHLTEYKVNDTVAILVYFEGSGNPADEHIIAGITILEESSHKMSIGNTDSYDSVESIVVE
jgi:hypothetical protein